MYSILSVPYRGMHTKLSCINYYRTMYIVSSIDYIDYTILLEYISNYFSL